VIYYPYIPCYEIRSPDYSARVTPWYNSLMQNYPDTYNYSNSNSSRLSWNSVPVPQIPTTLYNGKGIGFTFYSTNPSHNLKIHAYHITGYKSGRLGGLFGRNDIREGSNIPISLTVGLDTNFYLNGVQVSNQSFNVYENFNLFRYNFENQFPDAEVLNNGNTITVRFNSPTPPGSLTVSPTSGQSQTYLFEEFDCGTEARQKVESPQNFNNIKPSKKEMDYAINRYCAEGKELLQPYHEQSFSEAYGYTSNDGIENIYIYTKLKDKAYWHDNDNIVVADSRLLSKLNSLVDSNYNSRYLDYQLLNIQHEKERRLENQVKAIRELKRVEDEQRLKLQAASLTSTCNSTPGEICLLFGANLNESNAVINNLITNYSSSCNTGQGSLYVRKGDKIYFRVHSKENINPVVNWNPKVEYTDSNLIAITDFNGTTPYSSSYSDGFILSSAQPTNFPAQSGTAVITWPSFTVTHTDAVKYEIFKRTVTPGGTTESSVFSQTCSPNAQTIFPAGNVSVNVTAPSGPQNMGNTEFRFVVTSSSNTKWHEGEWKPKMVCTATQPVIGVNNTSEGDLTVSQTFYPVPEYSIYKTYPCGPDYKQFNVSSTNGGNSLTYHPNFSGVFSSSDTGIINFIVKRGNRLVKYERYKITSGNAIAVSGSNIIQNGPFNSNNIEISFTTDDMLLGDQQESLLKKLALTSNSFVQIRWANNSYNVPKEYINLFHRGNPKFGTMYRNWGQFLYNPVPVQGAVGSPYGNLIKEEALTFSESSALQIRDGVNAINNLDPNMPQDQLMAFFDTFEQQYIATLANMPFLVARADRQYIGGAFFDKWIGQHSENYSSATGVRAANMSESIEFEGDRYLEQSVLNTGAYAISKYSDNNSKNFSGGVSAFGGNLGGSKSWDGINNLTSDYIDLNGDRYPDVVGSNKIQYTTTTGGLYGQVSRTGRISISESDNFGMSASGSFSKAGDGESVNSKGNGFQRVEGFRGNTGAGISGNFNKGKSKTKSMYIDINGDGLADYLERNEGANTMNVSLNNGTPHPVPVGSWPAVHLFDSRSEGYSGGIGASLWNGSVEAGVSLTSNKNNTHNTVVDINGDGLMDFVNTENNVQVQLNTGNKLLNMPVWTGAFDMKNESETTTVSENAGATFALVWTIFMLTFKIPAVTANGSLSQSTSRTKKSISDFDGDGYPDLIEELSSNRLRVHSSRIGRTDMLKSVTNPLGGNFSVDYKVVTPTYDNPNPIWVMTDVTVNDGYDLSRDGVDTYRKKYEYEKPRYDRREREFYGFETVKSIDYNINPQGTAQGVYRTSVTKYNNKSYFLNGLPSQQYIYKGTDETKLFTKSVSVYKLMPLTANGLIHTGSSTLPDNFDVGGRQGRNAAAVVLSRTEDYIFELTQNPLRTEKSFKYDAYGRITEYLDRGAEGSEDDYKSVITYHNDPSLVDANIINVPKSIAVYKAQNNELLRLRNTEADASTGSITKVVVLLNDTESSLTSMTYNNYGNLVQVVLPPNDSGEEMAYEYTYDGVDNKYVEVITDEYGYTSYNYYDPKYDKITETIDITGNTSQYTYDSFGRLVTVIGPNEYQERLPYTIRFRYYPRYMDVPEEYACLQVRSFMPYAVTGHYDAHHPDNDIETITFIDGLARPVQVKKDIQINKGDLIRPSDLESMSFSGIALYDEFGRTTVQHHPGAEDKDCRENSVVNQSVTAYAGESRYDELDRVIKSFDAAQSVTNIQYAISEDFYNKRSLMTATDTDQGGQTIMNKTFKDITGKVTSTLNILNGISGAEDIWTRYTYNPIGEVLSYTDANESQPVTTTYEYDYAGRKVELDHADNGKTTYSYDLLGNILKIQTANLAADQSLEPENRFIKYFYDYTRLKEVIYPEMPSGLNIANVNYQYGDTGNETGRIIFQQDATGWQEFQYGAMGEIIHNKRTIVAPNIPAREFTTKYQYDSWNRLSTLTYPDGETVTYKYDWGGNLRSMAGTMAPDAVDYSYIKRIDYDHYEQRTGILYGNNTTTYYTYTPDLRRLNKSRSITSNGEIFLENAYGYDLAGNIKNVTNAAQANTINNIGGGYEFNYSYDNLNRLIDARGQFRGSEAQQENNNDHNADLDLTLTYNNTHGIMNKNQQHLKLGQEVTPNSYANEYRYIPGTHKVESITDNLTGSIESQSYDRNGNLNIRDINGVSTGYLWDEANRLRVVNKFDQGMHHYIYDASGERILKSRSKLEAVYENGSLVDSDVDFDTYTTYPSAFIVIDSEKYSKHYFAGSQRVVSRIGDADIAKFNLEQAKVSPDEKKGQQQPDPDAIRQVQISDLTQILKKAKAGTPSFKKYDAQKADATEEDTEDNLNNEKPSGKNATARDEVARPQFPFRDIYFYHPDYLGTSTFLTDANGQPYQFFLNLPFGETMAEQHALTESYETPYKFNGKELDEETGLYYYGARYYDPRTSIWLSTDPLMESYSNISPYVFCIQNPVTYVDPDGTHIDPSRLMKSKEHAKAFMEFASSKEGKSFLDEYASKGQKLSYNGKVYYEASEAGKYDKAGVNLNYNLGSSDKASYTGAEYIFVRRNNEIDINVDIAKEGFGSQSKKFNLLKAIMHESFLHADGQADDYLDDGKSNNSHVPKQFRTMNIHADHYYVSQSAIYDQTNKYAKRFSNDGLNILKNASKKWGLNFSDKQIKVQMWSFTGSLIRVDGKGNLKYED
jgi:RHS repeat-associated protein